MCTSPITIRVDGIGGTSSISVPCGKCLDCKRAYQNSWYVRLSEQLKDSGKAVFFTLTYNEDSVPLNVDTESGECFRSVRKQDVVRCVKRFRTRRMRAGLSHDFKYFITSEYGPRTQRPHYHGLIFGLNRYDLKDFFLDWQHNYGFTTQSDIVCGTPSGRKSIRYVSKYCSKGVFEAPNAVSGNSDPTFHLISKKIGFGYVSRMISWHLCQDLHINKFIDKQTYNPAYVRQVVNRAFYHDISDDSTVPVYRYSLPRYWRVWIYSNIVKKSDVLGQTYTDRSKDNSFPLRSQLQVEMSNLIRQDFDDLYQSKLSVLQSSFPSWSVGQTVSYMAFQEENDAAQKRKELYTSLAHFYDSSML